jgi:integrase
MENTLIHTNKTSGGNVKLFSRKNGSNPESLYLEIYNKGTQKRHLEFLGVYLIGDTITDERNIQAAKDLCIKYAITNVKRERPTNFTAFFNIQLLNIEKERSRANGRCALKKLHEFSGKNPIKFSDIDDTLLKGFKDWLLTKATSETRDKIIERGTASLYLIEIMRFANKARDKGYITTMNYDPKDIKQIAKTSKIPITFTKEEIIKLQGTPMPVGREEICKALILQFECGQRWSDIRNMTWEGLETIGGENERVFEQVKTGAIAFSTFNQNAINWISKGKEKTGKIFKQGRGGIPLDDQTVIEILQAWCKVAGINKHVGTHTMRRSCATLLYKSGADIYGISKILGHTNVLQTQKYIGIDTNDLKKTLSHLKGITERFSYNIEHKVTLKAV